MKKEKGLKDAERAIKADYDDGFIDEVAYVREIVRLHSAYGPCKCLACTASSSLAPRTNTSRSSGAGSYGLGC